MIFACLFWSCQQTKKSALFLVISPLPGGSTRGKLPLYCVRNEKTKSKTGKEKERGNKSWREEGVKAKARSWDCEAVSSSVHPSVQSIIKLSGNTEPKSK